MRAPVPEALGGSVISKRRYEENVEKNGARSCIWCGEGAGDEEIERKARTGFGAIECAWCYCDRKGYQIPNGRLRYQDR